MTKEDSEEIENMPLESNGNGGACAVQREGDSMTVETQDSQVDGGTKPLLGGLSWVEDPSPSGGWLVKFKDHQIVRVERLSALSLELDCYFSCASAAD